MTFETLDSAEASSKLMSLIESSFIITDDEMQEITVKTGKGNNENHTIGQSATQSSQVYRFEVGDVVIRIIDTPGIGDVRGIQKDSENLQGILQTISKFTEIHGILILLKPNDSRLTVMFRFCINELLSHLHRSAANNIIFGFTHTRGTSYRPGDTLPRLRKLLDANPHVKIPLTKNTIYCFDSESYRFLAAVKQGVNMDEERDLSRLSWDKSVKETRRMMEYVFGLKPHPVHETTSLNAARNLIIRLTKPLAEITRLIDINIKVSQDKIRELSDTKKLGTELDAALMVRMIDLKPRQLGYPRTVCTNSACVEVHDWQGCRKVNYKTICHERCSLQGVEIDTMNTPKLLSCAAMNGGDKCYHCGHGYAEHMHVVYELIPVSKTIENKKIREQIDSNASDAEKVQATINSLNEMIAEYKKEHVALENAAAQFGCFLKHNAILPYSDARIEYLDHLLREEKMKAQASGDESMVNSLLETKAQYLAEFAIIDKSISDGSNMQLLDPQNVEKVEQKLYQLKHFGQTLRNVRDTGVRAHLAITGNDVSYQVPPGSGFFIRLAASLAMGALSISERLNRFHFL